MLPCLLTSNLLCEAVGNFQSHWEVLFVITVKSPFSLLRNCTHTDFNVNHPNSVIKPWHQLAQYIRKKKEETVVLIVVLGGSCSDVFHKLLDALDCYEFYAMQHFQRHVHRFVVCRNKDTGERCRTEAPQDPDLTLLFLNKWKMLK